MRIKIFSPRINGTTRTSEKEGDKTIMEMNFFYDIKVEIKFSSMNVEM